MSEQRYVHLVGEMVSIQTAHPHLLHHRSSNDGGAFPVIDKDHGPVINGFIRGKVMRDTGTDLIVEIDDPVRGDGGKVHVTVSYGEILFPNYCPPAPLIKTVGTGGIVTPGR